MAVARNRFASAKTFSELEEMFESATSPENLAAAGERSPAEAQALYNHLLFDYTERDDELIQDHNNGLMR